jgi:DNA modification methylase
VSDISGTGWRVMAGSCLDRLKDLDDNSIDAVVTDPPYELGFMGKSWDSSGIAYNVEVWRECLRVLKPGGHILAFGGSRTWHRLAVAVEDAGFEVRDSIAWIYGSGFPKSLDVSKAIDKGFGENRARQFRFTKWMRSTGITARQIDEATNTKMGGHYTSQSSQPAIATADLFDKLRPYLPEVPEEIERLVAERTGIEWTAYKNREVIGSKISGIANKDEGQRHTIGASKSIEVDITAPATPEAQKWNGWGTALKPAFEPVVVGRKPFAKSSTVAANVLEWGVGGLNIDGTRIASTDKWNPITPKASDSIGTFKTKDRVIEQHHAGRWPSNVMLDEYTAGLVDEQQEGASRFFYVAKASKRDRNEGLDEIEAQSSAGKGNGLARICEKCGASILKPCNCEDRTFVNPPIKNFHPTVKPTDLMRQLIRLVTPPGGTVLDPFTGSGSTGKAAILEGFQFVGVELTEEYLPIIEGRLIHASQNVRIF